MEERKDRIKDLEVREDEAREVAGGRKKAAASARKKARASAQASKFGKKES